MDNIAKIDLILNLIIKCDKPPRLSDGDIHEQLKKINIDISSKEIIEILDKLVKDGFVIKDIQHSSTPGSLNDNVAYYFSSFEGRFFSQKGGYKSQSKSQYRKKIYEISMTTITVINIFAIIFLTFLNYKATDKANDNKAESLRLNSKIEHLTKTNDSLINIINLKKGNK